jgi:hypothetical protein
MQNANRIDRFRRLRPAQWRLILGAVFTLAFASATLRVVRFRRAIRFGSVSLGRNDRATYVVRDCVWAVEAAARRLPWRCVCIQQGLAVQRMLRTRGFDARLHYGARHSDACGKLEAHVWVTVGGEAVTGGAEASGFAEVAAYP